MWILPMQLTQLNGSLDMVETISDLNDASQICASSLLVRSKSSQSKTFLRKWKADGWRRLPFGRIAAPSHGNHSLIESTFLSLPTHANHFQQQGNVEEQKTQDISGPLSSTGYYESDLFASLQKTLKVTFRWDSPQSSAIWKKRVTGWRQAYLARLKSALRIRESGSSSWPTARAACPGSRPNGKGGKVLEEEVRKEAKWPTPEAFVQRGPIRTELTENGFVSYHGEQRYGAKLSDAVAALPNWPTMTANEATNSAGKSQLNRIPPPLELRYYLPTIQATEARQGFQDRSRGMKGQQESLTTVVVKSGLADPDNINTSGSRPGSWATPRCMTGGISQNGIEHSDLNAQAAAWSTPNAFCFQPPENTESWQKRATMQSEKGVNLHKPVQSQVLHENEKVAGPMPPSAMKLNPRWVETLMGLPVGWVMPSCTNPITPIAQPMQSMGGGNWMTPEAQNSTGYQISNGQKILRLGSQVMDTSTSPVTTAQTSCDYWATESAPKPVNWPLELSGRN